MFENKLFKVTSLHHVTTRGRFSSLYYIFQIIRCFVFFFFLHSLVGGGLKTRYVVQIN